MWQLETESLRVHSQYFRAAVESQKPTDDELGYVLGILEKAYKSASYHLPDDFLQYSHFESILNRLELNSSPGYPFSMEAPTIGTWLKHNGLEADEEQKLRLWHCVQDLLRMEEEEMIFNVFVKDEPHKKEKLDEGRCRLIMASPLHFQVLWHMLFDIGNDAEILESLHIPSQQGVKLPNGEWKLYYNLWKERGYDVGLDKRAWDWTVPGWKLELDLELRNRLAFGPQKQRWLELARWTYKRAFHDPVIMLSNGMLYKQLYPGLMKSGLVNTISTNSHLQVADHVLVCKRMGFPVFPLPVACGDDTLQRKEQVDVACYRSLGSNIKSASDGLEFVGHKFLDTGPEPLYLEKHLCNILHTKQELIPEVLDSMCRLYVNSERYVIWERLAELLGVDHLLMSRSYYHFWYHYNRG